MLYEPSTSISITDLNAFAERFSMVARKFPAAPQLFTPFQLEEGKGGGGIRT